MFCVCLTPQVPDKQVEVSGDQYGACKLGSDSDVRHWPSASLVPARAGRMSVRPQSREIPYSALELYRIDDGWTFLTSVCNDSVGEGECLPLFSLLGS